MSFECIINALFKRYFSGVTLNDCINKEGVNVFDVIINYYLEKLNNIPEAELKEANHIKNYSIK